MGCSSSIALKQNCTWDIAELPKDKKILGPNVCSPYNIKLMVVSKGTKQDWFQRNSLRPMELIIKETFGLVGKINSIKILLFVAVNFDWCQSTIKNVFLNGGFEEEVFMCHLVLW